MEINHENGSKVFNKRATFKQQLLALLKRNILIKRRNRGRTLLEILFPVYLIVIILSIKSSMKPKTSDAIPEPEGGYASNWFSMLDHPKGTPFPDFRNNQWFIVSENNSKQIEEKIRSVLNRVKYPNSSIYDQIVFNNSFKSSKEIERQYLLNEDNISFAIIFDTNNENNISYTIRMPFNSVPNDLNTIGSTGDCRDKPFMSSCDEMKYFRSGFAFLQSVVDSALIELRTGGEGVIPKANLFVFPKPKYTTSSTLWQSFVPTYLSWIFMPSVSILTVMFVLEKERKIKEGMLMMGLKMSSYWISWILVQTLIVIIVSLITTLALYFGAIIERINPLIIFILMFLYGISMIGVSALISPFFKKEKAAGSFVSFITLIASCVHLLVVFLDVSPSVYYLLALVSPVAFTLGTNSITLRTTAFNTDIGFNNLFEDPNFSVGSAILMMIFDSILYPLLAIYLDQVIPGEYGPKQSVFFFLKKSFWFPKPKQMTESLNEDMNCEQSCNISDVEEISDEMRGKLAISIENLTKVYGKGEKKVNAVNSLSICVYESQITGLLGHNGAGKSTLINMLVGNIAPTSGTAYIYGYDISNPIEMNALRQTFGVCLQQDILFDELNCVEHLNFFAQIKGIPTEKVDSEVNKLLSEVQLFDERMTASKKLSGGQKRKLSVAIALIANPKVILLDEPSSGVDPYSRRQLWSLLQSYKKDRVIILSTHFMDEADLLADRKAIIVNGKLRCVGTSMFLKNRFGIGYHLTVDIKKGTNVDNVSALVQTYIPNSQIERFTTSEVFYILPTTESQLFPHLFEALEQNISKTNGFLKSFGISMTTLEEVFLKIGEEVETESQNNVKQYTTNDSEPIGLDSVISDELNPSFWQSFRAFLYIRILIFIRNPMHTIPIIVLPIIMIIISYFLMSTSNIKNLNPSPLLLKPTIYSQNTTLLYKNSSVNGIKKFVDLVEKLGVRAQSVNDFDIESMANSFMATNISSFDTPIDWNFLFNDTYFHSLPILQNLMTNVFLNLNQTQSPINTYNHPFPQTDEESVFAFDPKVYTYVILMAVMLGSIPPAIAVEVVEDRESKIKNLLRVCGLGFRGYWLTTIVCHLIMFLISVLLILIATIFIIKVEFLQNSGAIGCVFILFLLFMPSSLITCYVMSHMFNKKDTARSILPILCYLPGMLMIIIVAVLSGITPKSGKLLHIIFSFIWPFYVPQGALLYIAITSNMIKISSIVDIDGQQISYFDWNQNITICFVALIFHLIFFSIILVFVDRLKSGESVLSALGFKSSKTNKLVVPSDLEDDDVRQERANVHQYMSNTSHTKTPIVLLNDLQKKYSNSSPLDVFKKDKEKDKTVIQNMSLLLETGHIFGLLGPNGAGKTTTMKIMICEEKPTEGTVLISGHRVISSDSEIFKLIGYCPQHDTLWKEITLKEHMHLFAAIRGIPRHRIETICQNHIQSMRISEHSDKKSEQLSGGTKRKLCYLMALLGRSTLVLLDEPSTGMDPKAKRFLWKSILKAFERNSNRSAVLTTHSMEETDALCTRLGIMIKGVMRCIGSLQHLKNKYGAGYVLEIKWRQTNESSFGQKLKQTIESFLTKAVVKEEYNNRLILDIPQESVESLSKIFSSLENLRESEELIEEYSFSQKTIEQVFIDFAKQQTIVE